jgi:polyhydroxyalkanoate synthesis regulator phasin
MDDALHRTINTVNRQKRSNARNEREQRLRRRLEDVLNVIRTYHRVSPHQFAGDVEQLAQHVVRMLQEIIQEEHV